MTEISRNKTVKIQIEPQADKDLINSTLLRNSLRSQLRSVQDKKPDLARHDPK